MQIQFYIKNINNEITTLSLLNLNKDLNLQPKSNQLFILNLNKT